MSAASQSVVLSAHVREEIDRWVAKFPQGRQRSAVIAALHAVQHENNGYLTPELMNAVAEYLDWYADNRGDGVERHELKLGAAALDAAEVVARVGRELKAAAVKAAAGVTP